MDIVIIGAIGTARNIIEQILDAKFRYGVNINIIGIIIDSFKPGTIIQNVPVIGGKEKIPDLLKNSNAKFIFCLYRPDVLKERSKILFDLNIPEERFTNFIHPSCYIAPSVNIGIGNVILSHTSVQSNVSIGSYNIINSNVTIEHETTIGICNFLAANCVVGANAKIIDYNFVGLNSSIREGVHLNHVFAGMHSLILNSYNNTSIIGIPAKPYIGK